MTEIVISYARTLAKLVPQPNHRLEVMKAEFYDNPCDTNQTEGIEC